MVFLILSNITLIFYVRYVGGVYLHNARFACTTALGLGQYSRKYYTLQVLVSLLGLQILLVKW